MKKLFKSLIGLLIAVAFLGLAAIFGMMAMSFAPDISAWFLGFASLSFMFMFFRWLAFLVHRE
jgi:hypothetical protein